jgi:hypothetical protein
MKPFPHVLRNKIPDNSRQFPTNPDNPSILATSGFASGFYKEKSKKPIPQTTCVPRDKIPATPKKFPKKSKNTSGLEKESKNFLPVLYNVE